MFSHSGHIGPGPGRLVLAAVTLGSLAVAVFATSDRSVRQRAPTPVATGSSELAPQVRSYTDLRAPADTPTTDWRDQLTHSGAESTTARVDAAQGRHVRALRRAFDGAPPIIPHPIDPRNNASCDVCHAEGLRLSATVVAPQRSHAAYLSCTQCHAPGPGIGEDLEAEQPTPSGFVGLKSSPGVRAWPGAPPTVPHHSAMRQRCLSCHGPLAVNTPRTTHPERAACSQCHVGDLRP